MHDVTFLITITRRADAEEFIRFFGRYGVSVLYSAVCHGTARLKTLSLLGLEQTEKSIHFAMVTQALAKKLTQKLSTEMQIDLPNRGIAVAVPVSSLGGATTMNFFLDGKPTEGEEAAQVQTNYELIVVVSQIGYSEMVMDAARSAGAGGGTVIHAKGTGANRAQQFFGVSLADEKEMIFIVAGAGKKKDIMRAIMQGAGAHTKAHALCFSIPVSQSAGFKLIDEESKA